MTTQEQREMGTIVATCTECGAELPISREQLENIGFTETVEAAGWLFTDDGLKCSVHAFAE